MLTKERLDQFLNSNQHQLNTEVYCGDEEGNITSVTLLKRSIGPKTFMLYGIDTGAEYREGSEEIFPAVYGGPTSIFQLMIFSPGRKEVFLLDTPSFPISKTLYSWYSKQNMLSKEHQQAALRRLSELYIENVKSNKDYSIPEGQLEPDIALEYCFGTPNSLEDEIVDLWIDDYKKNNEEFPVLSLGWTETAIFRLDYPRYKSALRLCAFSEFYSHGNEEQYLFALADRLVKQEDIDQDNDDCDKDLLPIVQYETLMFLRQAVKEQPSLRARIAKEGLPIKKHTSTFAALCGGYDFYEI